MTNEQKCLQAEIQALRERLTACLQQLETDDHTLTVMYMAEWSNALAEWNRLVSILEYDLGTLPAHLH